MQMFGREVFFFNRKLRFSASQAELGRCHEVLPGFPVTWLHPENCKTRQG